MLYHVKEDGDDDHVKAKGFSTSQVKDIKKWCEEELKKPKIHPQYIFAILFNLCIGLRYAELAALKWEDIDFSNETILIHRQRVSSSTMGDDLIFMNTGKKDVNYQKKHVKPHAIYLPPEAADILKKIKQLQLSDEYVFPPGHFRYHTYNDKIKLAAKAIGLDPKDYHTHSLRVTYATDFYQRTGGDILQVQYQMRHTTSSMTERYVDDHWKLDAIKKSWNRKNK